MIRLRSLPVIVGSHLLCCIAFAEVDADKLDSLVRSLWNEQNVPGLAVAVVTPEGSWHAGYGVRDLSTRERVESDTLFLIGSLT